jgi:D-alanine-D-alanine ligase
MGKKRVAIVFGGKSGEHEVSLTSAMGVYEALDKRKFDVILVGIDKTGRWVLPDPQWVLSFKGKPRELRLDRSHENIGVLPAAGGGALRPLLPAPGAKNAEAAPSGIDVVLPILHGTNGEDGTIQGLLELAGLPYVGSGVLGSALCMDKEMAKRVLRDAGLPVVPFQIVRRSDWDKSASDAIEKAEKAFGYPYFVKPANAGSSVGVGKVKDESSAREKFAEAFQYDTKVLVEKAVAARELEVSVLGNREPEASVVGEIVPRHEFYSYEAKYLDDNGADLRIPAEGLSHELQREVREMAIKAFVALDCSGLARVDFFLDKKTGELFINELNTLPGFTPISMYPKLWEATGLSYAALLEKLIDLALERSAERAALKTEFD